MKPKFFLKKILAEENKVTKMTNTKYIVAGIMK
jgi:hypothetical protein